MSLSIAPLLIYLIIPLIMLIAAIVAHRGKSFWGTWLMLIGGIGIFIAIIGIIGSIFYPRMSPYSGGDILPIVSGILTLGGFISYSIGFIALCARWGPTAQRAEALEELTASLIFERSQASN